jgi:hypothetical protein
MLTQQMSVLLLLTLDNLLNSKDGHQDIQLQSKSLFAAVLFADISGNLNTICQMKLTAHMIVWLSVSSGFTSLASYLSAEDLKMHIK